MIDVKELRLGNLITYESAADTDVGFEVHIGSLYRIEESDGEGYNPIPLTEEWFIKFGFKKNAGVTYRIGIEKGRVIHADIDSLGKFEFWIYDNMHEDNILLAYIKNVHQLQNLYHSLTGKELTFQ